VALGDIDMHSHHCSCTMLIIGHIGYWSFRLYLTKPGLPEREDAISIACIFYSIISVPDRHRQGGGAGPDSWV
jgi:hypothetical protein